MSGESHPQAGSSPADPKVSSPRDDDEIDLVYLGALIWRQKLLIAVCAAISLTLAAIYAEYFTTPTYKASAVFQVESKGSGFQLPSNLSGFASLAGLGGGGKDDGNIEDRVSGLDFVRSYVDANGLMDDLVFNTVRAGNQENDTPIDNRPLLTKAFQALGFEGKEVTEPDIQSLELQSVLSSYEELISLSDTPAGAFKVSVLHQDPVRAAALANSFVAQLKSDLEREQEAEQSRSLTYVSQQLADAILAVGEAEKAAQDFAVENNVSSRQQFLARSVDLNAARDLRRSAQERLDALQAIRTIYGTSQTDRPQAEAQLRRDHPIVDDEQFRISLGLPAAINEWRWPAAQRVSTLIGVETDRVARQDLAIEELLQEADELAETSIALRGLERDAAVAQATYEVLIQQAKAQDLEAGFKSDALKVFQTAMPPTAPAKPSVILILAAGLGAGLVIGVVAALLWSFSTGRIYTRAALLSLLTPRLTIPAQKLRRLRGTSYKLLATRAEALRSDKLTELPVLVNAASTKWVMLSSEGLRTDPQGLAVWLAQRCTRGGKRNAVLDMTGTVQLPSPPAETEQPDGFQRYDDDHVTLFRPTEPKQAAKLLSDADRLDAWMSMVSPFERIFVVCDRNHVIATARALTPKDPLSIIYTATGKPRWNKLTSIVQAYPVDVVVLEER